MWVQPKEYKHVGAALAAAMTKSAEHAMHTVVLSCKRARRQMLAGLQASNPTMH